MFTPMLAGMLFFWLAAVPAQGPQTAPNGDYVTNSGPVSAPDDPARSSATWMPGSLWRVLTPHLNCRKAAAPDSAIVLRLRKGTLLQAEVGGGGSDEVLLNVKDKRGLHWMAARSFKGDNLHCYVRANRLFIAPLTRRR